MPARHTVPASPETVHIGYFEARRAPVLTVASGDTVTLHTVSGAPDVLPKSGFAVLPEHRAIHAEVKDVMPGHTLTGPVAVEGLQPGEVLEVRIEAVDLATDWGWNRIRPLAGTLPADFHELTLFHLALDRAAMTARMPWGVDLALAPFFGVMGVAPPPAWGRITSIIPRAHGGNLDIKALCAGTTLYLPAFNAGGLFSAGDGHAVQGDGEVDGTAIETCLDGTFTLIRRPDMKLAMPRAESATHYITIGIDPVLDNAARQALRDMIAWVTETSNLSREEAYMLCSLAADLHVSQTVNVHSGAHCMLPKAALRG